MSIRVDLHCHSKYSKRPSLWLMQKLGCPESFTEPAFLYELARRHGMSAVTITDHNTIDGCLEIAHLSDTFTSCEYTTYFPEDRCKIHVTAFDITEDHHRALSDARQNIFDLVRYLNEHGIHHACAHPLFWANDRLSVTHVEKLVLLFKNWEWNGDLSPEMNAATRTLVRNLTQQDIERLSGKHNIEPQRPEMWKKNLIAGSDDHSSLNIARAYTEVPNAATLAEFWAGVEENHARVHERPANPKTFARSVYGTAYQFYKAKFNLDRFVRKNVFLCFLDRSLRTHGHDAEPRMGWFYIMLSRHWKRGGPLDLNPSLFDMARYEADKLIREDPQLMAIIKKGGAVGDPDQTWFEFLNQVSNKVLMQFGHKIVDRLLRAHLIDLFHSIGSAGALYGLLAPYFVGFSLHAKQRAWSADVLDHFSNGRAAAAPETSPVRVSHFTDTFHEINGVALTLQQLLATALELNKDYTIVTCSPDRRRFQRGVHTFKPVGTCTLPEYPELKMVVPPFLQILNHCYEEGFTHVHVATPGPVGLTGLGVARILQLPIVGTYHTALPQYGKILTDDAYVEELLKRYMVWFYNQLDAVYVPSRATGNELIAMGIHQEKVRVYPRGVNIERFHPEKRSTVLQDRYGAPSDSVVLLYVGRVSKEKNLHLLSLAFKEVLARGLKAHLVVTGDGPYRTEMEKNLKDAPAIFTGYLKGQELPAVYASSDILVFPSSTDTFGNVVLEAQASGTPVIVSDTGGPQENLLPGETGLVVAADDVEALANAMESLARDPVRRQAMGKAARHYMADRGFHQAFEQWWTTYINEPTPAEPRTSDMGNLMRSLAKTRALAS